jgi:hypothetical protein
VSLEKRLNIILMRKIEQICGKIEHQETRNNAEICIKENNLIGKSLVVIKTTFSCHFQI